MNVLSPKKTSEGSLQRTPTPQGFHPLIGLPPAVTFQVSIAAPPSTGGSTSRADTPPCQEAPMASSRGSTSGWVPAFVFHQLTIPRECCIQAAATGRVE